MDISLTVAASLMTLLGVVHSILGEVLIFYHWRSRQHKSTGVLGVSRSKRNILWASWHLVSFFGWALAALLYKLASIQAEASLQSYIENVLIITLIASALLVLVSTKGRHPAWAVLLIIVGVIWLG